MRALLILLLLTMPLSFVHAQTLLTQTLNLDTGHGVLQGTLLLPKASGRCRSPCSSPAPGRPTATATTRPATTTASSGWPRAWPQGVASLRYDKRGVGASLAAAPDERDLSVEAYVSDALAWSERLSDPRFGELILVGHSEGALIASLAAPRSGAAALISIAGSGRPIDAVLREQLQGRLPPALLATSHYLIDELKAGRTHADIPEPLQVLFRPSVQPYLISLFAYDPAEAFAAVNVPALIVQGRHDISGHR